MIDNAITNVTNTTTANITNNNGNISVDVNTGKVTAENGKAVSNTTNGPIATVEDVANTINNVGWRIGNNTGAMVNLVKAGNQVNFVNGSATIANVSAVNGTVTNVSYDVNVDNNTITVVDGKLVANTSNIVNQLTGNSTVTDGRANATVNNVDNSNKVATVGDIVNTINNVSWGVTSGNVSGTNGEFSITDKANATVKAGDTVTYNAGQNIKIEQNGKTFNISTTNNVTFNHVNTTTLTVGNASDPSNSTNITSGPDGLNVNGDKITGIANGTISNNSKDTINGSQLYNLGDSITNIFGGNTTFNTTTGQVEGFERTLNTTGLAKDENYVAPTSPANNITEAFEQLNNYVNAGWKVGGADGQTVERISPDEQVNFVNSDTITSTVVVNDKGGANISFNVNSTAIAKAATGTVSANTTTGKAESNNYNGSRPLATVTDVENTVNNVYHTVNATNSDIQVVATNGTTQIKAGDTLNFEAGKNLVVNQTGKNIAFGLAENISVNNINATGSITVGNTTINNGSVTNLVNNLNATNSIATNSNGKNASSADAPSIVNGTNAATVNDVLNTGWNLQENGKAKDFVAAYDTVNFVNGTGTTVTVTTTNGSTSVIKVDVVADGNTIKVQPNGNLTANTTNIVVNNGTASVDPNGHGSNLVNATTIVNTVNNVSWNVNAMASGTGKVINLDKDGQPTTTQEATPVKAGNTVNVNAGNNIEITRQGANITVATSMNPTFNTVQVGGNASGPIIRSDEKGNLVIGRPDVANNTLVPTQIKNVAPGTDPTDAVNVSQLKGSITNINNHINKVNKEARGGIAGSNAAASLPQVYLPGKSMMAASAGTFKGENAFAVGYSRASDNGKLILKLQGNANSQGDVGAGVGVGYQW
ncbi:hypothetical protein BKK50_06305 [Rodentibacter rarus]|uniref:Trimeric autotransporter adhesin YadA-like C-terminal membrane anchor domain-containing protein n=1 Tax=Rodentibacter rarus TaxID=1908260 RepID=A0A1V3ILB0_9PAST|nr:hypothetical protein BKK50_06305 [Rodentibacter rarus]